MNLANSAASVRDLGATVRIIVLAGSDRRRPDPLAAALGATHKCLVPLAGRPLIAHVLQTAAVHPAVESLCVCLERDGFDALFDVLSQLPGRGTVQLVEARENLVDSVLAAAQGWDGPLVVTTADHPLLTPASLDAIIAALDHGEAVAALARREDVLAVHPAHAHPFLEFAGGGYAACNLYAAANADALRAADVFRGGGRFAGNAWRVLRAFGPVALALTMLRAITLDDAVARLSRRLGLQVALLVLEDGSQALDVDDVESHAFAEALLRERRPPVEPAPRPQILRRAIA